MDKSDGNAEPNTETIAYHGRSGSFSEAAAFIVATGRGVPASGVIGHPSAREVVRAVATGKASVGVLGQRNTLSGIIGETADAFGNFNVRVVDEFAMHIEIALFSLPGESRDDIVRILSHPASLYQCEDTLAREFPHAETIAAPTSAAAADMLADGKMEPGSAVLCSSAAGDSRGLCRVLEPANDSDANETTFVVLTRGPRRARVAKPRRVAVAEPA